ncbi:MAG: hypothetical protein QW210_01245 [Candidatus Woesearchaeota archaeon]
MKKKKNNKKRLIWIVVSLLFIFVVIGLFFLFSSKNKESEYVFNGFTFYRSIANTWKFKFNYQGQEYDVALRVDPKSLIAKNYKLVENYDMFLRLQSVNIFSDPDLDAKYTFGMYDLGKIFASVFGIKVNYGVSRSYADLAVYNCSEYGFYFTKNNESNKFYWLDKCLVINTTNADVAIEYADFLVYHYLGVLNG